MFTTPCVSGVTCHVSNVMCHLSTVTCNLSRVTCRHYLQSVRAMDLKFWEKVHLPPPVRCHMSRVMCHMSKKSGETSRWRVCYQRATPSSVFRKSGEAYRWRVCYEQGLPHLVLKAWTIFCLFVCPFYLRNRLKEESLYIFTDLAPRSSQSVSWHVHDDADVCIGPLSWFFLLCQNG